MPTIPKPIVLVTHSSGEPPQIEALGFRGPSCEQSVRSVREKLGSEVLHSEHKPEFHERALRAHHHSHSHNQTETQTT